MLVLKMATKAREVVFIYKQGVEVPADVTKIIVADSVTEIPSGDCDSTALMWARGVFSHCKKLREVDLNEC